MVNKNKTLSCNNRKASIIYAKIALFFIKPKIREQIIKNTDVIAQAIENSNICGIISGVDFSAFLR